MHGLGRVIRWGWLLGIALCAPAALPAGGGQRKLPGLQLQQSTSEPFVAESKYVLCASPMAQAPRLRIIEVGTPIKILDHFQSDEGLSWLRIKLLQANFLDNSSYPKHGWVNI